MTPLRKFGKQLPRLLLPAIWILLGCGSLKPTPPPPTPTPIPAYVAGEEDLAHEAFAQYYDENCWHTTNYLDGTRIQRGIDLAQPGRAIYVGDGIWRFRIMEKTTSSDWLGPGPSEEETLGVEEQVITTRSLTDGSWEEPCPDAGESNEWEWDVEGDNRYNPEPSDFVEPDEGNPWDSVRR